MDLNTIEAIIHPADRASLPRSHAGDAFLAGGTWVFSEPQTGLLRLIDVTALGWLPLQQDADRLEISATCTLGELEAVVFPPSWTAGPLIAQCCRALLGSFKIRNIATVGGNLCLALPAGPMAALLSALDGVCTIWTPNGEDRLLPVRDFIMGANRCALREGEILRSVSVEAASFRRHAAFRQMSLTPLGRSAALVIGTRRHDEVILTITASVAKPVQLIFSGTPSSEGLSAEIDKAVPNWFDDVHGAPAWRRRITHIMAAEIIAELAPA